MKIHHLSMNPTAMVGSFTQKCRCECSNVQMLVDVQIMSKNIFLCNCHFEPMHNVGIILVTNIGTTLGINIGTTLGANVGTILGINIGTPVLGLNISTTPETNIA